MNTNIKIMIVLLLLVAGILVLTLTAKETSAETIIVAQDGNGAYEMIQDAINNATDGDTIRVYEGTYNENVVVNKSIDLVGNGSAITAIDGEGSGEVINITVDLVNISGFSVTNGSTGINVGSNGNRIYDNNITGNGAGINLMNSSNTIIFNNSISGNTIGIQLFQSSKNISAHHNSIMGNLEGINASENNDYPIDATANWWGTNYGPYHPEFNTNGNGDSITDRVEFSPWLDEGGAEMYYDITVSAPESYSNTQPNSFVYFSVIIRNNGTLEDNLSLASSDVPNELNILFPNGTNTGTIGPGNEISMWILVLVQENAPAGKSFFNNTVTSLADHRVTKKIMFTLDLNQSYEVSFNRSEDTYSVSPDYLNPGSFIFSLIVKNKGTGTDILDFEFEDDLSTQNYKKWITLPDGVSLESNSQQTINLEIKVQPITLDPDAIADGYLKNITFRVYSRGARNNNVEIEGVTTDSFLCHVNVMEYRHAFFNSIVPSIVTMDVDDIEMINVTFTNVGNGKEQYSFRKEGENGGGSNTDWYDFNISSAILAPGESVQVSIAVDPADDATVGIHDLYFHAKSETTYQTASESFRIDIEEEFGGKFVSGDEKVSDPGKSVSMRILVANTGNDNHEFYLDDPDLPEGWDHSWIGGNSKSIPADSSSTFNLQIQIPDDYTKAPAGEYQFQITGDYEDEGGGIRPLPGFALLNLTVNIVYGVRVDADETINEAEPGETVVYQAEVRNSGNINETYQLSILKATGLDDAKGWASIQGVDPGDQVTIAIGESKFIDIVVEIPDFTPENDEAERGDFGLRLKAKSLSDSDKEDEIIFELDVEEMYRVKIWSDVPGKDETLKARDDIEMSYTLFVRNLGNTDDDIVVNIPNDEFSGDKKDWSARFGSQSSKTLTLDSLEQTSVTLDLTINKETDPGEYILRIRAESQGDTSVYVYTTIYINLSKGIYDLQLKAVASAIKKVNPVDESEIEFEFTLTNTGNMEDSYTIEVETSTGSGTYKDWIIEFENKNGERVDTINAPSELPGQVDDFLQKNDRVDVTLYVMVAINEDEGVYPDIAISATSDSDKTRVEYLYFNLTVIKPNIRLSDDPYYFNIDPDSGIEEDDDVDINLRIYNDGTAETDEFYVWFYNGRSESQKYLEEAGYPIAKERVENIPAMSYMDILVTWVEIPAGNNDLYVYADKPIKSGSDKTFINNKFSSEGLVLESRENDNYVSIDDQYQQAIDLRPDLTIVNIDFDDTKAGEDTTVTVTIANVGSARAEQGQGTVYVKIGGERLRDKNTNSQNPYLPEDIQVDDDIDMEFTWEIPDEANNFTVKVSVEYPEDSKSSNDRYTTYVNTEGKTSKGDKDSGSTDEETSGEKWTFMGVGLVVGLIIGIAIIFSVMSMSSKGRDEGTSDMKRITSRMQRTSEKGYGGPFPPPSTSTQPVSPHIPALPSTQPLPTKPMSLPILFPPGSQPQPSPPIPQQPPSSGDEALPKTSPIGETSEGTKETLICSTCGNVIDETFKFCIKCGNPLHPGEKEEKKL